LLELALSNVSAYQLSASISTSGSLATDSNDADEPNTENMATGHSPHTDIEPKRRDFNTNSGFIETPSASRRSSQAYAIVLSLSDPIYVSPEDKEDGDSPARHNGSEDVHVNEMKILPRPASALSLIRPGSTLRLRPKRRNVSHSGVSTDGSGGLHDRYVTDSTDGEILLSPSASRSSLGSDMTAGMKMRQSSAELIDGAEKRMSMLSVTTVTFGPVS